MSSHGDQRQPGPSRSSTSDSTVGQSGDAPIKRQKHDHHFFGPPGKPTQVSTFASTSFNIAAPEFVAVSHCPDSTMHGQTQRDPLEETSTFSPDQTRGSSSQLTFSSAMRNRRSTNQGYSHGHFPPALPVETEYYCKNIEEKMKNQQLEAEKGKMTQRTASRQSALLESIQANSQKNNELTDKQLKDLARRNQSSVDDTQKNITPTKKPENASTSSQLRYDKSKDILMPSTSETEDLGSQEDISASLKIFDKNLNEACRIFDATTSGMVQDETGNQFDREDANVTKNEETERQIKEDLKYAEKLHYEFLKGSVTGGASEFVVTPYTACSSSDCRTPAQQETRASTSKSCSDVESGNETVQPNCGMPAAIVNFFKNMSYSLGSKTKAKKTTVKNDETTTVHQKMAESINSHKNTEHNSTASNPECSSTTEMKMELTDIFKPFELSQDKIYIPLSIQKRMKEKKNSPGYFKSVFPSLINAYELIDLLVQKTFKLKEDVEKFSGTSKEKSALMNTLDSTMSDINKYIPKWDDDLIKNKIDGMKNVLLDSKEALKNKKVDVDIPLKLQQQILKNKSSKKSVLDVFRTQCTQLDLYRQDVETMASKIYYFDGTVPQLNKLIEEVNLLEKKIESIYDYEHEPMKLMVETALKSLSDYRDFLTKIKHDIQLDMPEDLKKFVESRSNFPQIKVSEIQELKEIYKKVTEALTSACQLELETSQISKPLSELEVIQGKIEALMKPLKELKAYRFNCGLLDIRLRNTLKSLDETNELLVLKKLELQVDIPEKMKNEMKSLSTRGKINKIKNLQKDCEDLDKAVERTSSCALQADNFSGSLYQLNNLMQDLNRTGQFLRHFNTCKHPPLIAKVETSITSLLKTKEVIKEKEVELKLDIPAVLKRKIDQDPSKKEMLIKQLQENRSNLAKFEKEVKELVATADAFWGNMSELKILMEKVKSSLESVKNVDTYEVTTEKSRQQGLVKSLQDSVKLLEDREPMIEAQEYSSMEAEQPTIGEPPLDLTTLMNSSESMQLISAYHMKLLKINRKVSSTRELAKATHIITGVEVKSCFDALRLLTPNSELEEILISNLKDLCVDLFNRLKRVTIIPPGEISVKIAVTALKAQQIATEAKTSSPQKRGYLEQQLLECQLTLDRMGLGEGENREASRDVLHFCNQTIQSLTKL